MIMQKFIRTGSYSGKKCEFTHYNPKNGEVWSDDIENNEYYIDDKSGKKKSHKVFGKWVDTDSVIWED